MRKLIESIKESIQNSNTAQTRRKISTIKDQLGVSRLKQSRIDEFINLLTESGIVTEPKIVVGLPDYTNITFKFKSSKSNICPDEKILSKSKVSSIPCITVPDDFVKYLFDFGASHEYDKFQACLDSNSPIALFFIPKGDNNFYSSVIQKVLSFEILRKRQYKLDPYSFFSEPLIKPTAKIEFETINDSSQIKNFEIGYGADIFEFDKKTMENVILAKSGEDLIESEKFENQFNQLSLLANRYIGNQFFVLFHCPPSYKLNDSGERILSKLIQKVNQKFPYVFVLESKYAFDEEIPQIIRNDIALHFKLLNELPLYPDDINGLMIADIFSELQKAQIHFESEVFHKITQEELNILSFGKESDEHIYLKLFAIKTLKNIGFNYDEIFCELNITKDFENYEMTQRADIAVKDKIIIEIETLRGKTSDKDVYLALVNNIKNKSKKWSKLDELWLVFPGFEIARNYYQLQKTKELLQGYLAEKINPSIIIRICCPDYQNCQLVEIDFKNIQKRVILTQIKEPEINIPIIEKEKIDKKTGLDKVVGMNREKQKLMDLVYLIENKGEVVINGILFYGLPGCGKTYLANCFAETLGCSFFAFSPADITSIYVGQTQKNIRDIFAQARIKSPSVLFIDEIDSIGFKRTTSDGAHTDQKASINQLLIELNKLNENQDNVIVIGATNNLKSLDPALKRSGRFDYKIHILPPTKDERKELFDYYLNFYSIGSFNNEQLDYLSNNTVFFTSSDIKSICNNLRIQILLENTNIDLFSKISNIIQEHIILNQITLTKDLIIEFIRDNKSSNDTKIQILLKEWENFLPQ